MPEVNVNGYSLPNIDNSDRHNQDTAIFLIEILFLVPKFYFINFIQLINHF